MPRAGSLSVLALSAHRRIARRVMAYVDGELNGHEVRHVKEHLADCPDCGETAAFHAALRTSLRRLARRRPMPLGAARLRRWVEGTF